MRTRWRMPPKENIMTSVADERRRQRRYIVAGVSARVDGEACPIADISATAVRLLRPFDLPITRRTYSLEFTFDEAEQQQTYTVSATLVRRTERCFVLRYDSPAPTWESLLRSADTLEQTRLSPIFD
jgi:hypothetical protein